MKPKFVEITVKVKLGDYDFQCEKCKKIEHKSAYCIAQQASGNVIYFTCECGHKMKVPDFSGISGE